MDPATEIAFIYYAMTAEVMGHEEARCLSARISERTGVPEQDVLSVVYCRDHPDLSLKARRLFGEPDFNLAGCYVLGALNRELRSSPDDFERICHLALGVGLRTRQPREVLSLLDGAIDEATFATKGYADSDRDRAKNWAIEALSPYEQYVRSGT
jgi:hypothetical protein